MSLIVTMPKTLVLSLNSKKGALDPLTKAIWRRHPPIAFVTAKFGAIVEISEAPWLLSDRTLNDDNGSFSHHLTQGSQGAQRILQVIINPREDHHVKIADPKIFD